MSPPPLPTVDIACFLDGQWHVQRMRVMAIAVVFLPLTGQCAAAARRRKEKRTPPPRCPSPQFLTGVLEALCASGSDDTLQIDWNLHMRLSRIHLFSACRLGGDGPERERFGGKLEHWSALIESIGAASVVLYISEERQFFVICAKPTNTQPVNARSAICWLRDAAGIGLCVHGARGVFRIFVSRRADSDYDPWSESFERLMSAIPDVFPTCSFDDMS